MTKPPEPRMTGKEVLAEFEWFLDAGVHPLLILDTLHRSAGSVDMLARRWHNQRVRESLYAARNEEARKRRMSKPTSTSTRSAA